MTGALKTCGACAHRNLGDSPLRALGYGLCNADQSSITRTARTFSDLNVCRLGAFAPRPPNQAPAAPVML